MKILILSCGTGGGHNSAAFAVQETLHARGVQTELFDPIQLKSEKAKNLVSDTYKNIIKNTPTIFGVIYQAGAIYETTPLPSPVYFANSMYAKELNDYIVENEFDGVICAHLYCMEAMTAVRKKFQNYIPCYGILTDYTCIPFTGETQLDGYFIGHRDMKRQAVQKGLPKEKLYPLGIPVHPKFNERLSKEQARQKLNLPQDKKIILLLFGSVGCGKISKLCAQLLKKTDEDCLVYVIIGENQALQQKLDKKFSGDRVITVGYTRDVNVYMNAADVLISKAGGLSSTESAVANVPLVHLKSIPGCETKNATFFSKHNMSLATRKTAEAADFAKTLIYDQVKAEEMLQAQRTVINANAANDIVDTVMHAIARNE